MPLGFIRVSSSLTKIYIIKPQDSRGIVDRKEEEGG